MLTDNEYINAILHGDAGGIVSSSEEEIINDRFRRSCLIRFSNGVVVRHTVIAHDVYPRGIVYSAMPKTEIKIIEPEQRVIYKSDWIDETFKNTEEE